MMLFGFVPHRRTDGIGGFQLNEIGYLNRPCPVREFFFKKQRRRKEEKEIISHINYYIGSAEGHEYSIL